MKTIPSEESIEPTCEVCGGPHKTSTCDNNKTFDIEKIIEKLPNLSKEENTEPICQTCGGPHKTSACGGTKEENNHLV